MNLRPYQQQALQQILTGFNEFGKQLAVLPTGAGKTVLFSHLAASILPKRTLILCHRDELIEQAISKLHSATGIVADKEKAEHYASMDAQVVVGSVQSLQGNRLKRWPQDHFGLVVADEGHHAISASWQRVLNHFDQHAWILAVTATPDRGDKKNLGAYFENVAFEISLFDLINQGYLSRISVQSIPLSIDLNKVRQTAGDFNEADLGDALQPYLREIALAIREAAAFRRTLVFLPLIATSKEFVRICNEVGVTAAHVDGYSPDRKEILQRFANGEFELLANAMLLTEGFDDPGIDCVTILRPTKSRVLYCQMTGRGTRVAPCKRNLLLLDFLWLHEKLNLIRPAHLIATNDLQAEEMTEITQKAGGETQLDLEGLATEAQRMREKKLQEALAQKAKRKAKTIDAMEFCLSLHQPDIAEWEDAMPWHGNPVSEGQQTTLSKFGFDAATVKSAGHASAILDMCIMRSKLGLASPKQMNLLRRFKHPSPETATFEEASAFLDRRFSKGRKRQGEMV